MDTVRKLNTGYKYDLFHLVSKPLKSNGRTDEKYLYYFYPNHCRTRKALQSDAP